MSYTETANRDSHAVLYASLDVDNVDVALELEGKIENRLYELENEKKCVLDGEYSVSLSEYDEKEGTAILEIEFNMTDEVVGEFYPSHDWYEPDDWEITSDITADDIKDDLEHNVEKAFELEGFKANVDFEVCDIPDENELDFERYEPEPDYEPDYD